VDRRARNESTRIKETDGIGGSFQPERPGVLKTHRRTRTHVEDG
jgi:hypothetical protein